MKPKKQAHRIIAVFLTLNFLSTLLPVNLLYASNNGPNAPEVAGFEPVDATDMVNLGTGDLAYTMPLMEVNGFPITMAYHAGVPSTLDASWVGLGWYLNTGAINRQQIGVPDDWYAGRSINFISFKDSETYYSIGAGFEAGPAFAGVGMSWGGGKGLQGSVEAGVSLNSMFGLPSVKSGNSNFGVGVNGSLNTSGSYYVGAYARISGASSNNSVTASVGFSGGGGAKGTFNAGVGASNGMVSTGVSYNTKGIFSINAGGGGAVSGNNGVGSGGAGLSMGSFASGDFDVSVKSAGLRISGKALMIPAYIRFGRTKVTYSLRKGYLDFAYGSMYSQEALTDTPPSFNAPDGYFSDYNNRYVYMDAYEQALPQEEAEFISDFRPNAEKLNFTYAGYDSFQVDANGLSGMLKPRLFDNVTLVNRGFNGNSKESSNRKNHVFYHNSGKDASRTFGYGSNNQMQMYFEGSFSSKEIITPSNQVLSGSRLEHMVNDPAPEAASFLSHPDQRATSPSFVEVYTNQELYEYDRQGSFGNTLEQVIEPEMLPFSQRGLSNKDIDPNGIGAYKINSPDGKTYHFTIPVYHYESVKRSLLKENVSNVYNATNVSESRQYNKYATHWLLTAVTGPDYVDVNGDGRVGNEDYGYWVRLDYGKWSDGYTWKQPYEDDARNYTTNELSEIDDEDFGYFSFGRKQLYYLDQIVSREHTALFVKDLRYDAVGKGFDYQFSNSNAPSNGCAPGQSSNCDFIGITGGSQGTLNQSKADLHVRETGVAYQQEYTLKLDRIVLMKSEDAATLSKDAGSILGNGAVTYQKHRQVNGTWRSTDFKAAYGLSGTQQYLYNLHQQDNVIDINDYQAADLEDKVLREVRLNHDYALAKNSPNSLPDPQNLSRNLGKLTLNSVEMRGKAGTKYMPAYEFDYHGKEEDNISLEAIRQEVVQDYGDGTEEYRREYVKRRKAYIDNWGFIHDDEDRWSLKSIDMPTGALISIEYEEDQYWTEAFSRRFWEDHLEFDLEDLPSLTPSRRMLRLGVRKDANVNIDDFDFTDYFSPQDSCGIDFYISRCRNPRFSNDKDISEIFSSEGTSKVLSVTPDYLQLQFECLVPQYATSLVNLTSVQDPISKTRTPSDDRLELSGTKQVRCGGGGTSTWNLIYRILANKVPEDEVGGGLRVSRVVTDSGDGNVGILEYDYRYPQGHERAGRSSGITSFAPVDGLQFVPYQSELPNPGVQYEYVTLSRKDNQGRLIDYTQYNFHTLDQVINIFEEEIRIDAKEDDNPNGDKDPLFWAEVNTQVNGKVEAKDISLHVNTSKLGQYRSIEQYNNRDQLISSVRYDYVDGIALQQAGKGYVQESFNSLKSIFDTNKDGNDIKLKKRYLSTSTRVDYSSMLQEVVNIANGQELRVTYSDVDPILGSFRKSTTERADGTKKHDYRIPAYEVYPDMGPKSVSGNYANMLTQEAMSLTAFATDAIPEVIETTAASVTTWNNSTLYDDATSVTNDDIWRKHKTYVYQGALNDKGTFGQHITENDFNWTNPDASNNSDWKKLSETTRYNHFSIPLEVKDLNNNYAATKMGYDNTKTIAVANAAHTEVFYSGAEDDDGSGQFGGGVAKGAGQDTSDAHTGDHALTIGSGQEAYRATVRHQGPADKPFKISLWAKKGTHASTKVKVGGTIIDANTNEMVEAGNWVQLNYYSPIANGTQVAVTAAGNSVTVDDFRVHPITASMTSYVYNSWDELSYILGANNMATNYIYDCAGRLEQVYAEVAAANGLSNSGFTLINQYRYTYWDGSACDRQEPDDNGDGDGGIAYQPLFANIGVGNHNVANTTITVYPSGGSGQYEYRWSLKECIDPDPQDAQVCPGNLTPSYGNWVQTATINIQTSCAGQRAVYWCQVRDLVTGKGYTAQGNHRRQGCNGTGDDGGGDQNPQQ
ncbi:MAG: hypothetical protein AAGF77_07785 [Bacteroidota bacterium]